MNYLLIDGLSNYSPINSSFNCNITNVFYLYLSDLLKSNGHSVTYFDSRESDADIHSLENLVRDKKISQIVVFINNNLSHVRHTILKLSITDINYSLVSYTPQAIKGLNNFKNIRTLVLQSKDISKCIDEIASFFNVSILCDIKLDYQLIEHREKKTINIYSSFESTEINSNISYHNYRNINVVMKEIKNTLMMGNNYFHVSDQFFFYDSEYTSLFIKGLKQLQEEGFDFIWSCEISDKTIAKAIQVCESLKGSNLSRIVYLVTKRLPVYEIESLVKKLDLPVLTIVSYLGFKNISFKDAHNFTIEIVHLLSLTETYLELFWQEYEKRAETQIISNYSTYRKITNFFRLINESFLSHRKKIINKFPLSKMEKYYKLVHKYSIPLQIEEEIPIGKRSFLEFKYNNECVYSSWDIKTSISEYSIKTIIPIYISENNIHNESEKMLLDILSYSYDGLTIAELLDKLNKNKENTITKSDVVQYIYPLEELGIAYFVKYLR